MRTRALQRTVVSLVAVGMASVALAACGSDSSDADADSDKPFQFYMSADQSGPTKSYTEAEIGGIQAAIDKRNSNGGIEGRKIEFEAVDDQNDPTKAVNLLQKRLSSGDKPDLVYAGGSSSVSMSMLPVLTREKVLAMSASSAATLNDPEKFPYFFGDIFSTEAYTKPMLAEAEKHEFKTVAMLHSSDQSGQAAADIYKKALEDSGITFVSASYSPDALDMSPQLNKLKAKDPDALIISGYGTPTMYAFTSRAKIGWTDIPTYGDQLASTFPLASQMKSAELKNVKVVIGTSSLATSGEFPAREEMIKAIKEGDHGDSLQKVGIAVYIAGYDIPMLIAQAAEQAGSTDTEKVTEALENLKMPDNPPWIQGGPKGDWVSYAYSADNHFPTAGDNALQYVTPGTYNEDGLYVPGK